MEIGMKETSKNNEVLEILSNNKNRKNGALQKSRQNGDCYKKTNILDLNNRSVVCEFLLL
jgi:hypothetical protein